MENEIYRFEVYMDYDFEQPEYVARYYDLPVVGQGKTINDAIKEAQDNLKVYLRMAKEEGIEIPTPSRHIDSSSLSGKLTLRISKSMHEKIIERANREGVSINSLINEAVAEYIYKE